MPGTGNQGERKKGEVGNNRRWDGGAAQRGDASKRKRNGGTGGERTDVIGDRRMKDSILLLSRSKIRLHMVCDGASYELPRKKG